MIRIISTILFLGLFLAGCQPQQSSSQPVLSGPSGTITWSASADTEKPLAGIDQASICYVGRAFVIWSAFDGGGGSNWSSNVHGVKGHGRLWSRDDGYVEFQFETKDGKTGAVTINEAEYDLENGGLFLVLAEGGGVRIQQLKRDMADLQFDRESLAVFARNDAEISGFFARKE
jgi:hypothetical protein